MLISSGEAVKHAGFQPRGPGFDSQCRRLLIDCMPSLVGCYMVELAPSKRMRSNIPSGSSGVELEGYTLGVLEPSDQAVILAPLRSCSVAVLSGI